MAVAEDDVFTFTWCIHNFSHCALVKEGVLVSPKFEVGFLKDEFCLMLYPRGKSDDFISCELCRKKPDLTEFSFRLSILKSNGLFEEDDVVQFSKHQLFTEGLETEIIYKELSIKPDSYIDNDTLTIRCQLWGDNTQLPVSVLCHAHSKIKVSKLLYTWTLDNIDLKYNNKICESIEIPSFSSNLPSLKLQLLNREANYFDDDTIYLVINTSTVNTNLLLVYGIHLLYVDGSIAHSLTGRHLFKKSTTGQSVDFSFLSKCKLLSNEKRYLNLPKKTLTLQCEFCISSDDSESGIETFEYRKKDDLKMKPIPTNQIVEENDIWKKNMHKLFTEGEFSDFVVRTPSQQFPVHKAILCTQSEVFTAMLKHNMKEKNSNIVEIEDLEDDIVSKMLMYLYTNTLDDIDVPTAQKLYYAADKYRIATLQKSCSSFLIRKLDVSNVTEILVLADTHQDQELKSCVNAFILENVFDVINSEKWKNIMATHGHLTSEIMQEIICKKLFNTKFAL